jgi:hypothetical protein
MAEETTATAGEDKIAQFKDYLAEPRFRIKLDDLVNATVRDTLRLTADDRFPLHAHTANGQDVAARLKEYEDAVRPLQTQVVLLGKWATPEHLPTLVNAITRMSDNCVKSVGGTTLLLAMRWYPLSLLTYSAGIAALAAENYEAFAAVHTKRIDTLSRRRNDTSMPAVLPIVDTMLELAQNNAWKLIPGNDRTYTPESDYMLKTLQPVLTELLFLGAGFEQLFDRYEILRATLYADLTGGGWAPIGRWGTKHLHGMGDANVYTGLKAEAAEKKDQWGPIRSGLFGGSYARFDKAAGKVEEMFKKLNRF